MNQSQTEPINERKLTALELWNREMRKHLEDHLIVRVTRNRMLPLKKHLEKAEQAIQVAERFEVTKHRVIVDILISKLENTKQVIEGYTGDVKNTWLFQFRKRRLLKAKINTFKDMQYAYQQALLIVVNTPPPTKTELL
jgi:hypothetical protein